MISPKPTDVSFERDFLNDFGAKSKIHHCPQNKHDKIRRYIGELEHETAEKLTAGEQIFYLGEILVNKTAVFGAGLCTQTIQNWVSFRETLFDDENPPFWSGLCTQTI